MEHRDREETGELLRKYCIAQKPKSLRAIARELQIPYANLLYWLKEGFSLREMRIYETLKKWAKKTRARSD